MKKFNWSHFFEAMSINGIMLLAAASTTILMLSRKPGVKYAIEPAFGWVVSGIFWVVFLFITLLTIIDCKPNNNN